MGKDRGRKMGSGEEKGDRGIGISLFILYSNEVSLAASRNKWFPKL